MKFTPARDLERQVANNPKVSLLMSRVASDAALNARRLAPKDTGALRNSIKSENRPDGMYVVVGAKVARGSGAWYWKFVEYGTSQHPPRPFFRPGVQAALTKRGGRLEGDT